MQNHTDSFQPPHDQTPLGDAKEMFKFLSGVFLLVVNILAVFWAMFSKKPGSVGTRAYWFDWLCSNTLLLALGHANSMPDSLLFFASIPVTSALFLWHFGATSSRGEHVHTHCVGATRFGAGDNGKFTECFVGVITGLCVMLAGCQYFGLFVLASAVGNAVKTWMIDERDRHRSVQMADAIAEQEYMMEQYETFKQQKG